MARLDSMTPAPTASATQVWPPRPPNFPVHQLESTAPPSERYDGSSQTYHSFLTLSSLMFEFQAVTFAMECCKEAFIITNLMGCHGNGPLLSGKDALSSLTLWLLFLLLWAVLFPQTNSGHEAAHALGSLIHGRNRVFDHANQLWILAAESHWNDEAF